MISKPMRDVLLSNNDSHRFKTPAVAWKLAKFLLVVSGHIERNEL